MDETDNAELRDGLAESRPGSRAASRQSNTDVELPPLKRSSSVALAQDNVPKQQERSRVSPLPPIVVSDEATESTDGIGEKTVLFPGESRFIQTTLWPSIFHKVAENFLVLLRKPHL